MTERTRIFAIAHVVPGLEQAWLQHMRNFDTKHPGCHFEVCMDAPPDRPLAEVIEELRVNPALTFSKVFQREGK
jgi:hypothetical protein